jgi:hypothetical protein
MQQTTVARRSGRIRFSAAGAELAGWGIAAALGLFVTGVVAGVSADLLFTDGDSVIVPLVVRSIALGQPQDWALSPVLFLPETLVYGVLALLGLGMRATLLLNAMVNLLALYGALRLVSGRRRVGSAPVAGALLAFGAFTVLALLEGSATRDGPQFATMLATTSYYSATVIATVAALGLVRRALERPGRRPWPSAAALAGIAAVSVLSNPLFAVWAIIPVVGMLTVLAGMRRTPAAAAVALAGGLVVGGVAGYVARGLFSDTIVADSGNYFRVDQWTHSLAHYGGIVADLAATPTRAGWLAGMAALWVLAIVLLRRAWRAGDAALTAVAGIAVAWPPLLTAGAVILGTDAVRYLQPWMYLPLAALAAAPEVWRPRVPARIRRAGLAAGAIAALVAGAVAIPAVASAASRTARDLDCVLDWVHDSGRTGAGQFWAVRAPKVNLDDPGRLIQVDHTLRVYTWLTNRADAVGAEVTFLVQDASTYPFALPPGYSIGDAEEIGCGRYTIFDFGDRVLPLGPPRN